MQCADSNNGDRPRLRTEVFREVPYINVAAIGDARNIPLQPLYDETGRWHLWADQGDHLVKVLSPEWIQGPYFALPSSQPVDLRFVFFDLLLKRAFFPELVGSIYAIFDDIANLATHLFKIAKFSTLPEGKDPGSPACVSTELESLLANSRSLIDLLQRVSARLWKRVKLHSDADRKKKELSEKFAKAVLSGDVPKTFDEFTKGFGLSDELAHFYVSSQHFFAELRSVRGAFIHGITRSPVVVRWDDANFGLVVGPLFRRLVPWTETSIVANDIGSVNYLAASVVAQTIDLCERFACAFANSGIELPLDLAPGHNVYFRSFHSPYLSMIPRIINEDPWASLKPASPF